MLPRQRVRSLCVDISLRRGRFPDKLSEVRLGRHWATPRGVGFAPVADFMDAGHLRPHHPRPRARGGVRNWRRSIRQTSLGETLDDPVGVRLVAERQPGEVHFEGISRIDLLQIGPDAPGLVDLAEMAEC